MSTTHQILTDPMEQIRQLVLKMQDDLSDMRTILASSRLSAIASSQTPYTRKNRASPDLSGEQAVLVPTSVEELGIPSEQAVEENPVSLASEPCLNMASPNFGGEQADSVPPSVDQLGKLSTPNIRPYHVSNCATHMAPAKSPADVVPSSALIMDFRNLQYRRRVKHLVDHTDVASTGSNTINSCGYTYSS